MPDKCCFTRLHPELLGKLACSLSGRDIKNWRLASVACASGIPPRLHRVYLSANSRNIAVFRAGADHPVFCHLVREIVWDDARLVQEPKITESLLDNPAEPFPAELTENKCPYWFESECNKSVAQLKNHCSNDASLLHNVRKRDELRARLSFKECWLYYHDLLEDEDEVIRTNADIDTLKCGLQQFSNLKTVVITPVAHGVLFTPVYRTPMIRAFPHGFVYPIPPGWPLYTGYGEPPEVFIWNDTGPPEDVEDRRCYYISAEEYRSLWRGFRAVTSALAKESHSVCEFIIDAHGIDTGVNCYALSTPCPEYEDFRKIGKGLTRLDLSVFTNGIENREFQPFRTGLLFNALAGIERLRHFNFATTVEMDVSGQMAQLATEEEDLEEHFVPLASMFPIEQWSSLCSLGLSKVVVLTSDLIAFLGKLPISVRSIELSFLMFLQSGTCRELLNGIRDELRWHQRPVNQRPKLSISVPPLENAPPTRLVVVDDLVRDFLYNGGSNPFESTYSHGANDAPFDRGAVEKDWFEDNYARPYDMFSIGDEIKYLEW